MFKKTLLYILFFYALGNYYIFYSWYLGDEQIIIEEALKLSLKSCIPMFIFIILTHYFYHTKNIDHAQVISFPPIILLFSINLGFFISTYNMYSLQIYNLPIFLDYFRSLTTGLILVILAIVLLYISVRQFNSYNEDPNPISPSSRIIMKSIYQYSRNPMYLGMIIFQIGLGLMLSMLHISFFTVLTYFLFRYFVIAPEEKYLEQKFKQDYIEYKRKVRRWF
tara:strand:- start:2460 stop:3125 length:666 start_codon:yes stop_codon:yes gene_type:complete